MSTNMMYNEIKDMYQQILIYYDIMKNWLVVISIFIAFLSFCFFLWEKSQYKSVREKLSKKIECINHEDITNAILRQLESFKTISGSITLTNNHKDNDGRYRILAFKNSCTNLDSNFFTQIVITPFEDTLVVESKEIRGGNLFLEIPSYSQDLHKGITWVIYYLPKKNRF